MSQTYVEKEKTSQQDSGKSPVRKIMPSQRSALQQEIAQDDLVHGQPVIIAMRWILVASGLLLVLWNANNIVEVRIQIIGVLFLAIFNFYLQAQLLMKKPVITQVVYAASVMDLVIITLMILSGSGFSSVTFVYYFPAIAALAVAFPMFWTMVYALGLIVTYGLIGAIDGADFLVIFSRLLMIAAVAFGGNLFLRIERGRREVAQQAQEALLAQIRERQAAASQQAVTIYEVEKE